MILMIILAIILLTPIILVLMNNEKIDNLKNEVSILKTQIDKLNDELAYLNPKRLQKSEADTEVVDSGKPTENVAGVKPTESVVRPATSVSFEKENTPVIEQTVTITTAEKKPKENKPNAFNKYLKDFFSVESIISKLGIILLLIGIGYGFKLSYDFGYLTPELTIFLGMIAGAVTVFFGFKSHKKDRFILSQVLFGGGIAIFYITTYAAYLHYGLINTPIAFILLSCITVVAFFLSVMTNYPAISIIGLSGSLIVPFAVGLEFLGLTGFGLYVLAVSIMSMIVYFVKRWRVLQLSSILSLLIVLTFLLINFELTQFDAQLFLGLIITLWFFHAAPDFYYHIRKQENESGKLYSPIVAVINFAFTIFFAFKLSVYNPVPFGSVYIIFSVFYILISALTVSKNGVTGLSYSYTACTLVSIYITIIDLLKFDIQPIAVLGIAVILYWFWKKDEKRKLRILAHILSAVGYLMALLSFGHNFNDLTITKLLLQSAFYFLPMIAILFLQTEQTKKIFQTFILQVFVGIVTTLLLYKAPKINAFNYNVLLYYGIATTVLFYIYNIMHYSRKNYFYEKSLYVAPILTAVLYIVHSGVYITNYYSTHKWATVLFAIITIKILTAFALLGMSLFKSKSETKLFYFVAVTVIMVSTLLFDLTVLTEEFRISLLIMLVSLLLLKRFKKQSFSNILTQTQKFTFAVIVIYYIYYISMGKYGNVISIQSLVLDITIMLSALFLLKFFKLSQYLYFAIVTLAFLTVSVIDVYIPLRNNGILTLLWAFYSIGAFIYYLIKADRWLIYSALGCIVLVAAKLIFIDLQTISIGYKVITSLIFGIALLIVSYAIQPLIKKISENKKD